MSAPLVLLLNCPADLAPALQRELLAHDLLPAAGLGQPDVVLLWLDLQAEDAAEQVARLRSDTRRSAPVLAGVVADCSPPNVLRAADIGLDDCLCTADPALLAARARLLYQSRTRFAQASPLTGLPGIGALEREINQRLPQRGTLALLAFDVDHFKSYNDRYGYERGDGLLRYLWVCLEQALSACAGPGHFLAHLGGDDFFALVHPSEMAAVARRAIELFEAGRAAHYDPEDAARGTILGRARDGSQVASPLASLTVAAVTNEPQDLQHSGQLAAVLAELKAHGKSLPGSNYVPDRRQVHDNEAAWVLRQQQGMGTER